MKVETQNTQDWLDRKSRGIGASEIATIIGLNQYQTPFELWQKKTGKVEPQKENLHTMAGHLMEDTIARWFMSENSDLSMVAGSDANILYIHPEIEWAICTPDRMVLSVDGMVSLECKNTRMSVNVDDLPVTWFTQVQWQLGVIGLKYGYLTWCSQGWDFGYVRVEFNDDYFKYLLEEGEKFWNYVVTDTPPPPVNSSDVQKIYYKSVDGKTAELPDELVESVNRLRTLNASLKEYKAEKEQIEESLKMMMLDAEVLTYDGQPVATWKSAVKAVINQESLKANFPEVCKIVTEGQTYRTFRLK